MPTQPIFELNDVWHTYPGPQPVEALRGIDLAIHAGEYVAIIGANGSGKSTLARHLNALLLPSRGRVRIAGLDGVSDAARSQIRRRVQMVFQHPDAQIVATTVEEDTAFGPENTGVPLVEMRRRVQAALETVGLWDLRRRAPHQLSSGQKQRLAIAGALAVQPQALILDEATSMLDPAGRAAVLDLLGGLHAAGTTLVTITHEMEEAALADRVVVLDHGRVAIDGAPHEVFSQAALLRSLGLDVPPVAALAQRLGLPVCLAVGELLAALGGPPSGSPPEASPRPAPPQADEPVSDSDLAILVRGLSHTYLRGTPLEAEALRGVDLEVRHGSVMGLIGQTGSGKSTLMQHLNGLMRPQAGRVVVAGVDWSNPGPDTWAARRKVGLLFQQPEDQLFERFLGDDVAYGPRRLDLDHDAVRARVRLAMDAVGLPFEAFEDRLTASLSGGEQRRAALAGVLALQPEVLAADEPTAGLDPRGRGEILEIFRGIQRGGATLLVGSHRMEDIAALCDHVTALHAGRTLASGPARLILSRADLSEGGSLPVHPLAPAAAALRQAGWRVPPDALTVEEIASAVMD